MVVVNNILNIQAFKTLCKKGFFSIILILKTPHGVCFQLPSRFSNLRMKGKYKIQNASHKQGTFLSQSWKFPRDEDLEYIWKLCFSKGLVATEIFLLKPTCGKAVHQPHSTKSLGPYTSYRKLQAKIWSQKMINTANICGGFSFPSSPILCLFFPFFSLTKSTLKWTLPKLVVLYVSNVFFTSLLFLFPFSLKGIKSIYRCIISFYLQLLILQFHLFVLALSYLYIFSFGWALLLCKDTLKIFNFDCRVVLSSIYLLNSQITSYNQKCFFSVYFRASIIF